MKNNLPFYVLLVLLVVVDAWLLAHPNFIGRLGILFFKYDMIRTFPKALATVALTTAVCVGVTLFVKRLAKQTALLATGLLTLVAVGILVNTVLKFSSGSYAMTGAGFKTGAILMPIILVLVFANGFYEASKMRKPDQTV
ncbi:hypothetical protein P1X15_12930 [Runella sp. MFBS21]|uniref:hypothetical protein n=1 Tax=Runella sp. MFBS21 TaxID=3034018 RepID=UPI0023F69CDA|nr:hypothetical protein [Runella sp. MFBS21]MDF7818511.1 hypothetical protein [Runella sp. MFBS21]